MLKVTVDQTILVVGLVFSLVMGTVGGLIPSVVSRDAR